MMSGLLPPRSSRTSTMSHPTCCCASLDRCDRCDLLVGLEGFHLMSVARTPDALVLDVESCNQLVGCPGCGLNRTRPRSRGGGGDRRALGRGPGADPMAQTPMDMPRTHLPDRDLHRAEPLGVRPGRAWVCGRSAGRSDSCASREPPPVAWLGNWQPRGTPCGPTSSRACKPHLMTPPASQACGYWGLTSMCGTTRTDADEGPVSSPASWT